MCIQTPPSSPTPAGDAPLRCKQLTLLLDWIQQFEAQSRPGGDAVAFSVLLGDLNFDNCSLGEGEAAGGGISAWPRPPSAGLSPADHAKEQEHELFSHFRDPCRLGTRREQPWALGTAPGQGLVLGRALGPRRPR